METKTGKERKAVLQRVQLAVTRTGADESLRVVTQRRLTMPLMLVLAGELGVDFRWLWCGEISPAGRAAIDLLQNHQDAVDYNAVELLELTPQPAVGSFVCRYCGCTEDYACDVGCEWVDPNATICTACVELVEAGC